MEYNCWGCPYGLICGGPSPDQCLYVKCDERRKAKRRAEELKTMDIEIRNFATTMEEVEDTEDILWEWAQYGCPDNCDDEDYLVFADVTTNQTSKKNL